MRIAAVIGAGIVAGACSGLSDLTGGVPDSSIPDSGAFDSGTPDAVPASDAFNSSDAPPIEVRDAAEEAAPDGSIDKTCVVDGGAQRFCDDFDHGPLGAGWTDQLTIALDPTLSVSIPNSMRAETTATAPPAGLVQSWLTKDVAGSWAKVDAQFYLRPRSSSWAPKAGRVVLASIEAFDASGQPAYSFNLEVLPAYVHATLCTVSCVDSGGLSFPSPDGWQKIALHLDYAGTTARVEIGGTATTFPTGSIPPSASSHRVRLGVRAYDGAGPFTANYDDVVMDWR